MKSVAVGALLLFCVAATVQSPGQAPRFLFHAAQCLAAKKFLPSLKTRKLTFGYTVDEKSHPGRKVVYVVEYAGPARSNGRVFAVFVTVHDGRDVFNIQNNASFTLSKREPGSVSFASPPLGGAWTQEHLVSAIREVEKRSRFTIAVEDLLRTDESISCEAYTDPQGKRGRK